MNDHRAPDEEFSDQEMAFLRHAQFGELPPRVRPDQQVELTETDAPPAAPEPHWIWVPQG
ncbi:hypothetical protein [Krasilnikovia sp. MM14-A1259]|uniref:hypothetical protein n=1 Tax=Krasilnikovia sp. MM14-A1259 TaxID=3373539 RepID=UPI003807AA91